jgi:hypothetical protein
MEELIEAVFLSAGQRVMLKSPINIQGAATLAATSSRSARKRSVLAWSAGP